MKYAQIFAEQAKIPLEVATKLLGFLYEYGYTVEQIDRITWRLKDKVINDNLAALLKNLGEVEMRAIILEMKAEDDRRERERLERDALSCVPSEYSEKGGRVVRFFSEFAEEKKAYKAGDKVKIQIMREGKWQHPSYGEVVVSQETLAEVKKNFDENKRGIELAVDENHEPNHKALGWYKELEIAAKSALYATIELTKKGAELMTEGAYRYFSPEIIFSSKDEETGEPVHNLLIGGAFTNRPFFKSMQPLMASEIGTAAAVSTPENGLGTLSFSALSLSSSSMLKFLALMAQFTEFTKLTAAQKSQLDSAFAEVSDADKTDEMKAQYAEMAAKYSEETVTPPAAPAAAPADAPAGQEGAGAVSASEGATVTMQLSEVEALRKSAADASRLFAEAKKRDIDAKVSALVFSEGNKIGTVMPAHKNEVVEFASSLSDQQVAKFFSIIGKLQTLVAGEVGHSGNSALSASEREKVEFLKEKFHFSEEEAVKSVQASATEDAK